MKNCAKYQQHNKHLILFESIKIAFFTFLEGLKKWSVSGTRNPRTVCIIYPRIVLCENAQSA